MRAPTINLASRPFRNNTVYYLVFVSCFIALLVASVYNLSDFLGRSGDLGTLRHQLAEGQREYQKLYQDVERMKREISKVNLSLLSQKSAFVNGLILSRFFSWSLLFDRFEDLIPLDVKIRSIRPAISPKEIQIQIDGLAKKAENLYQFEANLSDSEYFSGVYPVSENTRESRNAINFELVMNYLPAGKSGAGASPPTPTAGLPATGESQPQEGGPDQQPDQPAGPAASASTGEPASAPAEQPGSGVKAPPAASARAGQPGNAASVPPAATAAPPKAPAQDAVSRPQAAPARAGQPGSAASVPPAATAAPPKAPAQGAVSQPQAVPAPGATGAPAAGRPAVGPGKRGPLVRQMTNKEFLDAKGKDRFLRVRGPLVPGKPDEHPGMTNLAFIEKFGLDKFLQARGGVRGVDQRRPPNAPTKGRKP